MTKCAYHGPVGAIVHGVEENLELDGAINRDSRDRLHRYEVDIGDVVELVNGVARERRIDIVSYLGSDI